MLQSLNSHRTWFGRFIAVQMDSMFYCELCMQKQAKKNSLNEKLALFQSNQAVYIINCKSPKTHIHWNLVATEFL